MTDRTAPSGATELAREADTDPVGPLWRGAQVLRLLSYLYALGFQIAVNNDLVHPEITWALFGFLSAWTLACGVAYYVGFGRNRWWVGAEIVIACALMLSTSYVASTSWAVNNQSWPTTLWATNAVISAAILAGPVWGGAIGVLIGGTSTFVKGALNLDFGRNATIIVVVATGMAVGLAATIARRAHVALTRAARIAAATEERERLSREVHDGVLQVLSMIAKRGREIGGPTTELAELAGEQERALRRLIADSGTDIEVGGATTDLGALLLACAGDQVSVSAPATPVVVDSIVAQEIRSAVGNVLDNVTQHAGPEAQAFVLLEDLDDTVVVSIRDDGVGIPPGRLTQAERQGRMGISKSIRGRIEDLGGTAVLDSGPGLGTEWELRVPVKRGGIMTSDEATTRGLRVMVVDDHPMWRDGVARDLEESGFEVVATADGVGSAGRRAAAVLPDVVLMDMQLPDGTGAEATATVLAASPSSKVLVLSASDERDDVLQAVKAGASGYLVKSSSKAELVAAVRSTADGQAVFTPGLAGLILGEYRRMSAEPDSGADLPKLTERETEVLRYVAKGLSAKQIASRLSLSHRTVENHVQATLRKLQLGNRVELTRYAIEHGLDD